MSVAFTRRRVLTVLAAAAGLPLALSATKAQARMIRWEGTALGAPASLSLYHTDEKAAQEAIAASVAELQRLEQIFSLYRADSAMTALNRDGRLDNAPAELIEVAGMALETAALSGGAFDPTVQPLWSAYFSHFTTPGADPNGPSAETIAAARALVGWQRVAIDGRSIAFATPGMGLTLNGIAQGWITDRVTASLRAHGLDRMLVDMGEPRALAAKPDGSAWRIGIAHPADPARSVTAVDVVDRAVATSGGYGTTFDGDARFTHLIDPTTGTTAPAQASVTVITASAARADALSTALSVAPAARRQAILSAAGDSRALFIDRDGNVVTLQS